MGNQKFCRLCSITYHVVESSLLGNLTCPGTYFPQRRHPGYPHRTFSVYILEKGSSEGADFGLLALARLTAQFHRFVLLVPEQQAVHIYVRNLFTDNFDLKFTSFNGQEKKQASKLVRLLLSKPNYEGRTLMNTVCTSCGDKIKQFRKTGKWYAYAEALMYYLGLHVNATIEFIKVTGQNWIGKDDRGRWSDWTSPLLNGSVAIASNRRYTVEGFKAFSIARPAYFIFATFVTA